jgi:RNA polymerase sigma-70 factor (ECF subfamily)
MKPTDAFSPEQERRWVDRAKAGDQAAFEALVRAYEKRVFALTLRLCGNPEDAREAAQDAFLAAWQGLAFFRGDASFSTWLYRLTANACTDLLRREQRHASAAGPSMDDEALHLDLPASGETPHEAAERAELRQAIETGLQTLPAEFRTVLILRELHQLSYEEIAQVTDVDLGTVKSRISRGRRLLRKFLVETGNFSPPQPSKDAGKEGRK